MGKLLHGHARRGRLSPTYWSWFGVLQRCTNQNNPAWEDYGGRGITVCARWLSFENFLADMGERPEGCTIDRKDNDKGYCKENCRWATPTEQCRNRSSSRLLVCRGETRTLVEWSELAGRDSSTVASRLALGLSVEDALFGPPLKRRSEAPSVFLTYRGDTKSLRVWAKELGVKYDTMWHRLRKGWLPEEVVHGRKK